MKYWAGAALVAIIAAKAAPARDLSRLKRIANLFIICEFVATMARGIFCELPKEYLIKAPVLKTKPFQSNSS